LVTGASRGIGRAIARELAREGARICIVARSAESLAQVDLEGAPDRHWRIALDLTVDGMIDRLVEELAARQAQPEIIVHNLGGSHGVFQTFTPAADWQRVWHFNLGIAHEINRHCVPLMIEHKWGRIVHLSTLSTLTHNGYAAYVAAKCAVDGYVQTVNREVSRHNVILSAVAPGAIYSEGRHFAKLQKENPAALEAYFDQHLPIRRLGTAEDIASVVAFMCSNQASFMAGSIVRVDGGGN
jgi:NAD(P)-dependent dehydrogenase (short-subunit alcohol dehydrogenase family)